MIGYKAFNKDLTCKGFQYKIGQTYSMNESPILCERGFHFCKSIAETYMYYGMSENTRICKIEALGEVVADNDVNKLCTNKIKILEEITEDWTRKGNSNSTNSGYRSSGNRNSGNCNSGNYNSGNYNSGSWNSGTSNSGDYNSGASNSGNRNSGHCNSGYKNSGDYNSGNWNLGKYNSGHWNLGNYNSGDWNSGHRSCGLFNTEKQPKIKMFDKESDWTFRDWARSDAIIIMSTCPCTYSDFIRESEMTEEEKENHPEYKTTGGYIKTFVVTKEDKEKWWNDLSIEDKNAIRALPNFDFDKFRHCVGF